MIVGHDLHQHNVWRPDFSVFKRGGEGKNERKMKRKEIFYFSLENKWSEKSNKKKRKENQSNRIEKWK